ncbi:unnamed protein product [Thlaspi arvense]|uniref:NADP-dependent oxidoreductase domain-containing protein n=1 Tax=Thlaspi arvense TaxID=13288 RepID=A0AAU9SD12_THLAR|nr:unnamed protein product [Thlaspi arvense]
MEITLNSGYKMPIVGLGVWRMEKEGIRDLIINAIKIGYRHLDCAADYRNEAEVGEALSEAFKTGLVKREDLFVTTKLWNSDHGHVIEACKDSLKKLQLDYLDLYLVHFPVATRHTGVGTTDSALGDDGVLDIDTTISLETTWHDMEKLVSMGLVRSIGISNYDVFLTRDCLAYSKIKPAVNQIETHPYFQRDSLVKFCQKHGVCVTAHTPLGGATANAEWFGTVSCLDDPALKEVAEKYKKTVAQVVLRWGIQRNTVVIPKTSKPERLGENFEVLDFELTKEDMELIKSLDRKYRTNQPAKMENGEQYENGRYKSMWNMMPQHQIKEQHNALVMNKKIMSILAERDAAIQERNQAVSAKKEAVAARDEALQQRDKALSERDKALIERDSAFAALQHHENSLNFALSGGKHYDGDDGFSSVHKLVAFPLSTIRPEVASTKRKKESKRKGKKVGEDLNRGVAAPGKKCRTDWDSNDVGLNLVTFDETTMQVPLCTCTGTARQCYKWGNGGWQSSCCTTTLSQYPLPQMPNKRHSRVGGRKMSGNVFSRLLSRLASEGYDLSCPVDLKDYWARHGTNRYITIK